MKNDWTALQKELIDLIDELGPVFADRAAGFDTAAQFPTENYQDLRDAGLLKLCIPVASGGIGADYETSCLVGARIGQMLVKERAGVEMPAELLIDDLP